MNTPGTSSGNWVWRFSVERLDPALANDLQSMVEAYGRLGQERAKSGYDPYDYTAPGAAHQLFA
jgi:hypothetical protein